MKSILMAAAVAATLGLAACGQGANEEAGEAADTAYEQSTTGTTDLGQGPAEEAGEAIDQATDGAPASNEATTPAPTTP
jgi:ABC-type glycerol-3-phosphate transport system substrate-binding protein